MNHDMPIRKLHVDLSSGFARYWHGGDPYRTSLFNSFSMMFPPIEEHMGALAQSYLPAIKAAGMTDLYADAQAFIGQEATHRFMHQQYNAQLARQGFSNWVDRAVRWRTHTFRDVSGVSKLAVIAALEHVAGAFGEGILRTDDWLAGADPELCKIWRWHAAEEAEHKSVAFDIFLFAGGGYWRRIFWYVLVILAMLSDLLVQTTLLLARDGLLWRLSSWRSALRFWLLPRGILWQITPLLLSYLSPRFHPGKHDNNNIVQEWRRRFAGDFRIAKASVAAPSAAGEPPGQ